MCVCGLLANQYSNFIKIEITVIFFLFENRFCILILHGLGFVTLIYSVDKGEQTHQGLALFRDMKDRKHSLSLFFFFLP